MKKHAFEFGPFRLFPVQRVLEKDGELIKVSGKAIDILLVMIERSGTIISNEELRAEVWPNTKVEDGSLRVHMSALRKILCGDRPDDHYIINQSGKGYSFVGAVRKIEVDPSGMRTAPAKRTIPALVTSVVGRDEFVLSVVDQLPASRFVTITGPGGVGKTTAALAIGNAVYDGYRDGCFFIDLGSLKRPEHVATTLAARFGIGVFSNNPLAGLLSKLVDQNLLIILDNCEHLIEASANVCEAILRTAPEIHILATSREPLNAEGEWQRRLAPLRSPDKQTAGNADDAISYPAVELFVARAMANDEEFRLSDENAGLVARLCRDLDGIPLAIEFAASRIEEFGIEGVCERINDRFRLLNKGKRTALPRQRTLRSTLDWSYDLLSEEEARTFRQVSMFRAKFMLTCAEALAGRSDIDSEETEAALGALVSKSLLVSGRDGGTVTYHMLEMTQEYAFLKLSESGEQDTVSERHANHCLRLLKEAENSSEGALSRGWFATYGTTVVQIRQSVEWSFSENGNPELGIQIVANSSVLFTPLGLMGEHLANVKLALQASEALANPDPAMTARLYSALGNTLFHTEGHLLDAGPKEAFLESVALSRVARDRLHEFRALSSLSAAHIMRGSYAEAIDLDNEFKRAGGGESHVRHRTLSHSNLYAGRLNEARYHLDEALGESRDSLLIKTAGAQFDLRRITLRATSAIHLWLVGKSDSAMALIDESVREALEFNHPISLCHLLATAAVPIAFNIGGKTRAMPFLKTLRATSSNHSMIMWQQWAAGYDAAMVPAEERRGTVHETYLRNLAETSVHGPRLEYLASLGDRFSEPWAVSRALEGTPGWCKPELIRAEAAAIVLKGGGREQAESKFRQALFLADTSGMLTWELRAASSLAAILRVSGRKKEAHGLVTRTLRKFSEGFTSSDYVLASMVAAACATGDMESA